MSCVHRKALTRYQMLFRHMFYCKHVERQLCSVWISNKTAKQHSLHSAKWCVPAPGAGPMHTQHRPAARACSLRRPTFVLCARGTDPRPLQGVEQVAWVQQEARALGTPHADALAPRRFAGAFTLRQRMLNFVQNIQYYMMFEVMEPTWHVLEKNLRSVSSVPLATCLGGGLQSGVRGQGGRTQTPQLLGGEAGRPGRTAWAQAAGGARPSLRALVVAARPGPWGPSAKKIMSPNSRTKSTVISVFCLFSVFKNQNLRPCGAH